VTIKAFINCLVLRHNTFVTFLAYGYVNAISLFASSLCIFSVFESNLFTALIFVTD